MAYPFRVLRAGRANRRRITISIAGKYVKTGKFIYYRLKYRDRDSLIVPTIAFDYCVFNGVDGSADKHHQSPFGNVHPLAADPLQTRGIQLANT